MTIHNQKTFLRARDQQGNILHQDTIIDQQTIACHNWSLTDTINVRCICK